MSVLLPLLIPLLAHAKPLITPASPLPGTTSSAPTESVIKSDPASAATALDPGSVRKAEPSRSLKHAAPKASDKSLSIAPSGAMPGLYLSSIDEPGALLPGYRFKGLLPPSPAARVVSKAGGTTHPAPSSQALAPADAKLNVSRVYRRKTAPSEALQAGDPCIRTHSGTLVIRTGQPDSPCSGAEFRAQVTRQLKAAMADIDASATGAGSAGLASPASRPLPYWHHVTITSPPPGMSVMARAPGEDNLRRLNSRASWADQYQTRMADIRIGR
jgi:hypothetical protein